MTKREMFFDVRDIVNRVEIESDHKAELMDAINHEIELLDRKSARVTTSPTKNQIANAGICDTIYEVLSGVDHPVTVSELQTLDAEMGKYSNQKLSALLRQMVNSGRIVKTADGKKSYFSVA